jgi:pimeloyl-ACP methyl ester carboxylesterase
MNTRKLYGLLVGIDDYPAPVPSLSGCVNDIRAVESLLNERAVAGDARPELQILLNKEAKRQAIIDGFLGHLSKAGKDDVVLFYYSGHGSQERTPPELWQLEPDRLDETLVCYDSRLADAWDLADKEIASLLAHVAKNDPHILVILDCCHSGSGTRAPVEFHDAKVRRIPTDGRERPIETFFVAPGGTRDLHSGRPGESLSLPRARHVAMAACREDEEAKETTGDGKARGLFSFVLSETLGSARAGVTYRDIYKRVNAQVRARAARQCPVIESTDIADLNRPFLGGALQQHTSHFTVSFDKTNGWIIDGGTVHGIPALSGTETTVLAVYGASLEVDEGASPEQRIGEARVTRVLPATATVAVDLKTGQPDPNLTYRAVITSLPLPAIRVQIVGEERAASLVRQALAHAGPGGTPSLLVSETQGQADLRLFATADGYSIMRANDDRPLQVEVVQASPSNANGALERLEHIARWIRVMGLENPSTRLPADAVSLDLIVVSEDGQERPVEPATDGGDLRFPYIERDGKRVPPTFKIRVKNNSGRRLYCILLDLPETYGVFSGLLEGNGAWLNAGEEAWAKVGGDTKIPARIPDALLQQGVTELKDTLKVIASTDECDATLLDQDDLDVRRASRGTRSFTKPPANTLERLMRRVQTRHFGAQASESISDWIAVELSVTIVCPRQSVPVPDAGGQVELAPGVTLMGHGKLKAVARLSRDTTASRDVDLPALPPLPPWLVDDPRVVMPFQFSSERGGETGLSTLDLDEVVDADAVTKDTPLVLRVDRVLDDEDTVLPLGFDGEFFLPLGWAEGQNGSTEIHLESLPQPLINRRSLKGSIRIFFKKVSSKWLGTKYDYPLLAAVEPGQNDELVYVADKERVRLKVQAANRILLYVHGIIGDTQLMAASAFRRPAKLDSTVPLLRDRYDLVLAFDYENLNTPIGQTASDLKRRLEDVGLGESHGKVLHIVAHSMGGLVGRWLIEQEGGRTLIQHLIMLGTPNGGTPWPDIENWVKTLIGIGLNNLARIPWPPTVLGALMRMSTRIGSALVKSSGTVEATLDEMKPESEFLKALRCSADPGVRYSIIAGNTSLIPIALETQGSGESRFKRLLRSLTPKRVLYQTTALAFFAAPNDIAVSVSAIGAVPHPRVPTPFVREVACDHLSYFATEAGLKELAEVQSRQLFATRPAGGA